MQIQKIHPIYLFIYLFFVSNSHQQFSLKIVPKMYLEPCQTSNIELSAKILTNFHSPKLKIYVLRKGFKNTFNFNNFPD